MLQGTIGAIEIVAKFWTCFNEHICPPQIARSFTGRSLTKRVSLLVFTLATRPASAWSWR